MSSEKSLPENLEGKLKPCPADFKRVGYLMQRARKDLSTAKFIAEKDLEAAYQLLYDSMLHAALACMAADGVQPDIRGKHKTVVDYVAHVLGRRYEAKMQFYDRMRRKRHQLIYEPGPFLCTEKEMAEASRAAAEFVKLIAGKIKSKHPQKEMDF